jgi:hypothetical protein
MSNYFEYCTLEDLRGQKMPAETSLVAGTGEGTFALGLIREVSGIINGIARREFVPTVATRYFNATEQVSGADLLLDKDLLSVTTVTNGDAVVVAANERTTRGKNETPYWAIRLLTSSSKMWTYSTDPEDAITVAGIWGYHDDYTNAWETLTTLAANSNTSATSLTLTAATGNPGELWMIGSEFFYLSARTTTTATVVPAVNGSTAAAHTAGNTIYRWRLASCRGGGQFIPALCRNAVAIKFAIRENPQIESITVDNHVVSVPKDISAYIRDELIRLGLVRQ